MTGTYLKFTVQFNTIILIFYLQKNAESNIDLCTNSGISVIVCVMWTSANEYTYFYIGYNIKQIFQSHYLN